MNRARLTVLAVLGTLALGALFIWTTRADAPVPQAAGSVNGGAAQGVGALGRVEPASRVRKLGQPGGLSVTRVERMFVTEGDLVTQGQLLAELSDAAQKDAAVAQASADLLEARAALQKSRAAGRPSEIAAQRARIASLKARDDMSRLDAERAEALVPRGAGARADAERKRAAAIWASADRAEAEAQLETLSRSRPEDLAVAEARVQSAEATLARARADAALSRVTAPIAGTILKVYARAGDLIGTDGLLELADLDRMDVTADVYETDLPRLRPGAAAEVIVPGEAVRFPATVREIGWLVRRTTQAGTDPVAAVDARTVEVRLTLSEAGRQALRHRINMQVQVAIAP